MEAALLEAAARVAAAEGAAQLEAARVEAAARVAEVEEAAPLEAVGALVVSPVCTGSSRGKCSLFSASLSYSKRAFIMYVCGGAVLL